MDRETSLVYLMSYQQDLQSWENSGILERELKMISDINRFTHIFSGHFVTRSSNKTPKGINYETRLLHMLKILYKSRNIIFVTNQDSSLIFGLLFYILFYYKSKLIYRSGYNQVEFFKKRNKRNSAFIMLVLSHIGRKLCAARVVSNELDAEKENKDTVIIPNSEEISSNNTESKYDFIHVGRKSHQKRSELVYKVLNNYESIIITDIIFNKEYTGTTYTNIPNKTVLAYMQKSKYFLLLSEFEGSPKSLIEAISMGCIPILSNEVIRMLPLHLQKFFVAAELRSDFSIANLEFIENTYLQGLEEVVYYFSRNRAVNNWRKIIDDVYHSMRLVN